jgi:hypothetical protein
MQCITGCAPVTVNECATRTASRLPGAKYLGKSFDDQVCVLLLALALHPGGELSPPNPALLTQQGGTLAFQGRNTIFRQDDTGILK